MMPGQALSKEINKLKIAGREPCHTAKILPRMYILQQKQFKQFLSNNLPETHPKNLGAGTTNKLNQSLSFKQLKDFT